MKKVYAILLTFSCLMAWTQVAQSQCASPINHWESAVLDNHSWKYIVPNANIPGWQQPGFNAAGWATGNGGMGYGDNDDTTLVPTGSISVYMRRTFNIVDTSVIHSMLLAMDYDDGFVAYLNGVEIARSNITPVSPNWNTLASASHEARLYQNLSQEYFAVSPQLLDSLLVNGNNVLCVETHNQAANSNDLTSRPFLFVGLTTSTVSYSPLTNWFVPPVTLYTNLPILTVNTLGQTIKNDPRIVCEMGMIYNGPGQMNCIYDPYNDYNGKIAIEFRGSSSQSFPKKPYGFSTLNNLGTDDSSVTLLGLPAESDWVLLNPYTDKTFMRDVIMHDLGRAMGWYTTRAQFLELVINGQYKGIYVLLEKIKRDDNRVDIAKLTNTMNSGDSVTGGYIFKIDWMTGNSGNAWFTNQNVKIQNHVPKWNEITTPQQTYLTNYINNFENVLWGPNATDPATGYRSIINPYSFADFFILQEFCNNLDGYRASNYMHKDRDSRCGRFTVGPFWDFNITLGNSNFCNGDAVAGWQKDLGCADGNSIWFNQLLTDQWFKNMLNCRYQELRQGILSKPALYARIDTYRNHLLQAHVRDSALWQVIGIYVWPNQWTPNNWQSEIDSMKSWISGRLDWIDANIYPTLQPCNSVANGSLSIDEINFHSEDSRDAGDWFELHNYGATPLDLSHAVIFNGDQHEKYCVLPVGTTLAVGARLVVYADSLKFATQFPNVSNKVGPLCFKLSNAGQKIVIRDKDNKLMYSVDYADTWQYTADGYGRTLQLSTSGGNPNAASSWFASCIGGSPGVAYTPCVENPIISEINYASSATADAGDWIELYNKNATPFNLSGWSVKDGGSSPGMQFPAAYNLAASGHVALYEDGVKFNSRFPAVSNKLGPLNFGLSSSGDVILLYDNAGKLQYSVCYLPGAPWPTAPNGGGKTLENGQFSGNHNEGSSWFAGCPEGSPGTLYDPSCGATGLPAYAENGAVISLYPNPASDYVMYSSSLPVRSIVLRDATGKELKVSNGLNKRLDLSGISAGIYYAGFTLENAQTYFVKFVKE